MSTGVPTISRSYRDPQGCTFHIDGHVYRYVRPEAKEQVRRFLDSLLAVKWVEERRIPGSLEVRDHSVLAMLAPLVSNDYGQGLWLEHEVVSFVSYPFAWTPSMLHAAA